MTIMLDIATVAGALTSALALWAGIRVRRTQETKPQTFESRYLQEQLEKLRSNQINLDEGESLGPLPMGARPQNIIVYDEKHHRMKVMEVTHTHRSPQNMNSVRKHSNKLKVVAGELTLKRRPRAVRADVPIWALGLLTTQDAQRYEWEWGAHLHQLIEEDNLKQARVDRRRLAFAAITLAVGLRVRRALSRAR